MGMAGRIARREGPAVVRFTSVRGMLGAVCVAYTDRGICAVDLASEAAFARRLRRRFGVPAVRDSQPPRALGRRLGTFFSSLGRYDGPVDLSVVGPFERRVLEQLRAIPRGQVRTYREVARALGRPGAARAVGQACARNPIPLIIPCHRVVRSDGRLGGYSLRGGVALKRRLLVWEGVDPDTLPAVRGRTG
jgi:methylated-DNA-[protein]-cysteine S-methyltransferase